MRYVGAWLWSPALTLTTSGDPVGSYAAWCDRVAAVVGRSSWTRLDGIRAGRWIDRDDALARSDEVALDPEDWQRVGFGALWRGRSGEPVLPKSLELSVSAVLVDHGGRTVVRPGALSLLFLLDHLPKGKPEEITVSLRTWTDAWLPFDLAARPQPRVAAANAPRLAELLTALHGLLGECDLEYDDDTLARPTLTGVENLTDADDELWDLGERANWYHVANSGRTG